MKRKIIILMIIITLLVVVLSGCNDYIPPAPYGFI